VIRMRTGGDQRHHVPSIDRTAVWIVGIAELPA
jgi:hypothetical protein